MVSKISAVNFLSWKSLEFYPGDGVTLIDGWNVDDQTSEGSGKSAVLNALSWCLYGKIPKEANVDDVISHGQKSCSVQVDFEGISIYRSRKPNDLYILAHNYTHKEKGKDARETQKLIEEFVGLSFDAFCQSVYFAQNDTKKFISANQEDRGKILSEIQDLELFDKARKEVVIRLKTENTASSQIKHLLEIERKNIEILTNQINHENQMMASMEQQKANELLSLSNQLISIETRITSVVNTMKTAAKSLAEVSPNLDAKGVMLTENEMILETIHGYKSKIGESGKIASELDRLKAQGKMSYQNIERLTKQQLELKAFIKNPTKDCPTCGTLLEKCDISHAQQELDRVESEMKVHADNMSSIAIEMEPLDIPDVTELREEVQKQEQKLGQNKLIIAKIEASERSSISLTQQIETLGQSKLQLETDLEQQKVVYLHQKDQQIQYDKTNLVNACKTKEETDIKINDLTALLSKKQIVIAQLDKLKSGFKDIKSYVFNSALNEINARTNRYLERLFEVPIKLKFTNENMKIGTELSINGNPQGLGLLSGGQYRRASLSVDLAMSDVVSSRKGNAVNMLILDEYFKDLSEQSMEKCLNLLEGRGQPVLLIEHNSIFQSIINNKFFVNYEKGISSAKI